MKFDRDYIIQFIPIILTIFCPILIIFHILSGICEGWNDFVITGLVIISFLFLYSIILSIYQIYFTFTPLPSNEYNKLLDKHIYILYGLSLFLFIISLSIISVLFLWKLEIFGLYSKILIFLWGGPIGIVLGIFGIGLIIVMPFGLLYSIYKFISMCRRNL